MSEQQYVCEACGNVEMGYVDRCPVCNATAMVILPDVIVRQDASESFATLITSTPAPRPNAPTAFDHHVALDYSKLSPRQRERIEYARRNFRVFKHKPSLQALARDGWLIEDETTAGAYMLTVAGRQARDEFFAQHGQHLQPALHQDASEPDNELKAALSMKGYGSKEVIEGVLNKRRNQPPSEPSAAEDEPECFHPKLHYNAARTQGQVHCSVCGERFISLKTFDAKMVDFDACAKELFVAQAERDRLAAGDVALLHQDNEWHKEQLRIAIKERNELRAERDRLAAGDALTDARREAMHYAALHGAKVAELDEAEQENNALLNENMALRAERDRLAAELREARSELDIVTSHERDASAALAIYLRLRGEFCAILSDGKRHFEVYEVSEYSTGTIEVDADGNRAGRFDA